MTKEKHNPLLKMRRNGFRLIVFISILIWGCKKTYQPKPKGYNKINLPEVSYKMLPDTFPYIFEYSNAAKILNDSSWISERYWIDVYYPYFDASIQISYKPIHNPELMREYITDAWKLTSKHQIKAYAINEFLLKTNTGKKGCYSRPARRRP